SGSFGDGGTTGDGPPSFGTSSSGGGGSGGSSGGSTMPTGPVDASFPGPDCPGGGCPPFPPMGAPACSGAPAVNTVYPNDGVLVPPDMNTISIQWTPYGAPFKEFEVDFHNNVTNVQITSVCGMQTMDTEQPPQASGGCELVLDQNMWQALANANRGG